MAEQVKITDIGDNNNITNRTTTLRGIDVDLLKEYIDTTIYELIPSPPALPSSIPPTGEYTNALWVANWGMLADFGGSTDPEKDLGAEWVRRWAHEYPARFGVNPIYRFFHGDSPLFYIYNPTSYVDPDTGEPVPPDTIIWKIDGQEVHTGNYLNLFNVEPTATQKLLTVEITNAVGTYIQNLSYVIANSDEHSFEENFSSQYGGSYVYNPNEDDGKGKAIFTEDPRFKPRRMRFKITWNDYGNGKNRARNFNDRKPELTIDGVNIINNLQNVHGDNITINDGNDIHNIDCYIEQPPGPAELRIFTSFNFTKGFKRQVRKFEKKFNFDINLDSPLNDVVDIGTIKVGKRDEKR